MAVLCNHKRAMPKRFNKSMENISAKINAKQASIKKAEKEADKKASKSGGSSADKALVHKKENLREEQKMKRLLQQLEKLKFQQMDEKKTISLDTSKLNYLDPRISVAWCKKHGVPIDKVYNNTQRERFRWAIDMAEADFVF